MTSASPEEEPGPTPAARQEEPPTPSAGGATAVTAPAPDVEASPVDAVPARARRTILAGRGRTYGLTTLSLGLACCALESVAASAGRGDAGRLGGTTVTDERARAEVLLVAGTVTHAMADEVRRVYDAMPQPRRVVAFGACATSGGPYWDSYSVLDGVGQIVPVDTYVPGCPPRPEDLLQALALLEERDGQAEGTPS